MSPRRGAAHRGPLRTTKEEREERTARLMEYLREAGNIPDAKRLAANDHFSANTSAWITALSRLLK